MKSRSSTKYMRFSLLMVAALLLSLLTYYPAQAKTYTYYVHKTSKLYTNSGKSKQFMRYVPINAKLKTKSSRSKKMVKVTYGGMTGYVYRSNLWTKRTIVTLYIHKTSYLYSSRDNSKQRTWKIAINKKLTTDSNLNYKMYHVNYKGKRGYVYKVNLSRSKTTIVKYVKKKSKQYKNYEHTKRYSGYIPLGTRLETQSPQSNKMFWVTYKGRKSYVYAVNLQKDVLSYSYNNTLPDHTYGVVSKGGNHGIWDQPYGIDDGARSVGRISDYERVPLNVLREAKVGNVVWYQVSVDGRTLGWIHKSIVQVTSNTADDGSIPHIAVANVKNTSALLYTYPGSGIESSLNIYANLKLKIDRILDNGVWVHIKKYTAGTSLGWVRASDLYIQQTSAGKALKVNYGATIASSMAPIFDDNDHFVGYSGQFNADGRHVQINQEKKVENEERYRISYNNHAIGWVISTALNLNNPSYDRYRVVGNNGASIYNGQASGDAPNTNDAVGPLAAYSNRMLEVIKTWQDWSFIKYNDWYGSAGKDIDVGWVRNSDLANLRSGTEEFQGLFQTTGGNQQGLAYNSDLGIYYVGYDTGTGQGKIIAYDRSGKQLGTSKVEGFGHACALVYKGGKLYEVSSAGQKPVLHVINPDPNSLAVEKTITLNQFPYYVAMMAAKDDHTLLLLTESVGGKDTFYEYDLSTGHLEQTLQIDKMGIVQGLHYENGKLYFLANNYLTVLEGDKIIDRFQFSIPSRGTPEESEGLTMVDGKLAIGFRNHTIYIQQ